MDSDLRFRNIQNAADAIEEFSTLAGGNFRRLNWFSFYEVDQPSGNSLLK